MTTGVERTVPSIPTVRVTMMLEGLRSRCTHLPVESRGRIFPRRRDGAEKLIMYRRPHEHGYRVLHRPWVGDDCVLRENVYDPFDTLTSFSAVLGQPSSPDRLAAPLAIRMFISPTSGLCFCGVSGRAQPGCGGAADYMAT